MVRTVEALKKRLINKNSWHTQSIYLSEKFVKEVYLDFLSIIQKDKTLQKYKIRTPNQLISLAIRRMIINYVNKIKEKIKQYEANNNTSVQSENSAS